MKSFNASQRVMIIFLTLFIVVCCFLIVRLEIRAANLQSQWDEHKKSLNENMDVLNDLKLFARNVKSGGQIKLSNSLIMRGGGSNNHLILDPSGSISFENLTNGSEYLKYDSKLNWFYIRSENNKKGIVEMSNGKNFILLSEGIKIFSQNDKGDVILIEASIDKKKLKIIHDDTNITLGEDYIEMETTGDIDITSKNGNVNIKGKKVKVNE